jgi:hypothetical protein
MRKTACGVAWALFLMVASMTARAAQAAPGRDAFEGRWAVTVTPDDGGKAYEDTLTFAGNKFVSQGCRAHGFAETEYEPDTRGGQIATFTATATSKTEGSAKWTGTAAATEIQGTFAWTKADGSVVNYTYRGTRAVKK